MGLPPRRHARRPGRALTGLAATLAVLLGCASSALAADILELRGGFGGSDLGGDLVAEHEIVRAKGRGETPAHEPRPFFDDGDAALELPPLRDLQDLPVSRSGESILRLGQASRPDPVADGRVERPMPRPGSQGSLPGGEEGDGIVVVRQDVRDLIAQVARFYGFETVLTRSVQGEIVNQRLPSDFQTFLDRLEDDENLVFYFRDRELNASARSENVSRVIGLGPSSPIELRSAIEAAGVDADRFPIQFIETSNSVLVNGPPSFVGLVEVIAESLVRTDRTSQDVVVIRGNQIERTPADDTAANPSAPVAPPAANGTQ